MAAGLAAVLLVVSCGDGQDPWCEDLGSLGDLEDLAAAIASGDGPAARNQLDDFDRVADSAPEEIAGPMREVADVLSEAVEVSLASDDLEDLEVRREAVNQRLARIPEEISEVSSWAEEECGIRLD